MQIDRSRLINPYTTDLEYIIATYGPCINERACAALAMCNNDRFPKTYRDWYDIFTFLGVRIRLISPEVIIEPLLRWDNEEKQHGMLLLPEITNRRRMFFWLLHEAAEAAMGRGDLAPELQYPPEWGDHHTMACIVEWCHTTETDLSGCIHDIQVKPDEM